MSFSGIDIYQYSFVLLSLSSVLSGRHLLLGFYGSLMGVQWDYAIANQRLCACLYHILHTTLFDVETSCFTQTCVSGLCLCTYILYLVALVVILLRVNANCTILYRCVKAICHVYAHDILGDCGTHTFYSDVCGIPTTTFVLQTSQLIQRCPCLSAVWRSVIKLQWPLPQFDSHICSLVSSMSQ